MSRPPSDVAPAPGRRGFLARLATAAVAAALPARRAGGAPYALPHDALAAPDPDAWLAALGGRYRQIFHTVESRDGRALQQAAAYLDAYPSLYGAAPADVRAVIAADGVTLAMLLADAVWKTYLIGEFGRFTDPRTGQPPRRNPYLAEGPGEVMHAGASVRALAARGVTFLACDRALTELSRYMALQSARPQPEAYAELRRSLVPGTVVVPALVVSIGRAQARDCTYVFCG